MTSDMPQDGRWTSNRVYPDLDAIRSRYPDVHRTPEEGWWVGSYRDLTAFRGDLKSAAPEDYVRFLYNLPDGTGTPEVHHIVEQRHLQSAGDAQPDDMPGVLIPKSLHQQYFTGGLNEALPARGGPYSHRQLVEAYDRIYQSTPELGTIARGYLDQVRPHLDARAAEAGVPVERNVAGDSSKGEPEDARGPVFRYEAPRLVQAEQSEPQKNETRGEADHPRNDAAPHRNRF